MAGAQTSRVVVTAMGHFHPDNHLENAFFDQLGIESDAHWVVERTGIESRTSVLAREDIVALRHGHKDLTTLRKENRVTSAAELGLQAWRNMNKRFPKTAANDVDALICGTSVPDFDIPANACAVAGKIGLNCLAFDANSACSSFVTDLHVARGLLGTGVHKKVAIVNPERYSLRMDYADKRTCILFGDGCATAVIESAPDAVGLEVLDTIVASDPGKFDLITIGDNDVFQQNGKAVQKFAITKTIEITKEILAKNGLTTSDLAYFMGHQANLRMVSSVAERLGVPPDRHLYNVDQLGNQGAAGAPAVLSMNWDKFKKGDLIVMAVVGSGLTWGAALFRAT